MQMESAVRVTLSRLYATRHGRDVPLAEIQRELEPEGVAADAVEPALRGLQERRIAVRTARGWRPASPPPVSRAHAGMAQFSWLHI